MKTTSLFNRSYLFGLFSLLVVLPAPAQVIYSTNFSSPDYTVGALSNSAWTITNSGNNTQWIVEEDSTNPSAPTSLPSGKQPISPLGDQLLWFSPNTTNVSANQVALLTFASSDSRLQEPFKLTMDMLASPTGGAGQSFTMHLARDNAATTTTAPRFSFTSVGTSTMSLNVWDAGVSTTNVATLPKNSWLRFELDVNASLSSNGTYTVKVYSVDSSGTIIDTLYTSGSLDYTLSSGFNSMRFLTNASRTDYWVSGITVAAVPEPQTIILLMGVGASLLLFRRRRSICKKE